jgi:hypothetical protein
MLGARYARLHKLYPLLSPLPSDVGNLACKRRNYDNRLKTRNLLKLSVYPINYMTEHNLISLLAISEPRNRSQAGPGIIAFPSPFAGSPFVICLYNAFSYRKAEASFGSNYKKINAVFGLTAIGVGRDGAKWP